MVEIILTSNLAAWSCVPPEPEGGVRSLTQEQKLAHLAHWKPILDVRKKIVAAFRPREGETDVFIHPFTGERLSYPNCLTEQVLTPDEIELLDEEDPFLGLVSDGWTSALAQMGELISEGLRG
jgi:hypothetical protein